MMMGEGSIAAMRDFSQELMTAYTVGSQSLKSHCEARTKKSYDIK